MKSTAETIDFFGPEEFLKEISRPYNDRRGAIGVQGSQISAILKTPRNICSRRRVFICIDGRDEFAAED